MSIATPEQYDPTKIYAPFTGEQVWALNRYQHSGVMHPFTCGSDHDGNSPILVADTDGWRCPGRHYVTSTRVSKHYRQCEYTQGWAWQFMANPDWLDKAMREVTRLREPEVECEKTPVEDFGWPCERRVAHREHLRIQVGVTGQIPPRPTYRMGNGQVTDDPTCPGVRAHPATAIGSVWRPRSTEEGRADG